MLNQLKGKIVSYEGKKAKVISGYGKYISIILQENGKFTGNKINTSTEKVKILDKKKHPERYQEKIFFQKKTESNYEPAIKTGSFTERQTKTLYIDSRTQEAFNETGGGNYITQEELAAVGQIHRSAEGSYIFKSLTNYRIDSKKALRELFIAASKGEINLSEALKNPSLEKYTSRTSPYAFD